MASTTSTKIFTWASFTSGKKQTQAEVAAAQAVIVEQARLKKDAEEAAKLGAWQKQVLLKNIKLINERALLENMSKYDLAFMLFLKCFLCIAHFCYPIIQHRACDE